MSARILSSPVSETKSLQDLYGDDSVSLGGSIDGLNEWLDTKEQPPTQDQWAEMMVAIEQGELPPLPAITTPIYRIDPAKWGRTA